MTRRAQALDWYETGAAGAWGYAPAFGVQAGRRHLAPDGVRALVIEARDALMETMVEGVR